MWTDGCWAGRMNIRGDAHTPFFGRGIKNLWKGPHTPLEEGGPGASLSPSPTHLDALTYKGTHHIFTNRDVCVQLVQIYNVNVYMYVTDVHIFQPCQL